MNRNFWKIYWPPIAWAAVLFIQSGFLLMLALREAQPQRSTAQILFFTFILGTLYGFSDELHQYFVPGRFSDWRDAVADAVGVALGGFGFIKFEQQQRNRQPT